MCFVFLEHIHNVEFPSDCISPNPWRVSTNIYPVVWPDSGQCVHTPSKDQRINRMDKKLFGGLRSASSPNKLTVTADLFPRSDKSKNLSEQGSLAARTAWCGLIGPSLLAGGRCSICLAVLFDTTGVLLATGVLLVWLIYRVEYQLLNWLFFFLLSLRRFLKSIRHH